MPVNTQPNVRLVVSIDGTDYACQIIEATFKAPGVGASTVTETACPEGVVGEPGASEAGSLTGSGFTDTTDTGITFVLMQAFKSQEILPYIYTEFPDDPTKAVEHTGTLRVASWQSDFSKPAIARTPIDLEILTWTPGRPAAAA